MCNIFEVCDTMHWLVSYCVFYSYFYLTLTLGSTSSHCATVHAWSPDSRYFMTASLAPRMNVDNNLKVFKYNGFGPVAEIPFDRAYDVIWRPALLSVYPNRGPSPKRINEGEAQIGVTPAPVAKPTVAVVQLYRPPGTVYMCVLCYVILLCTLVLNFE